MWRDIAKSIVFHFAIVALISLAVIAFWGLVVGVLNALPVL